MLPTKKEREEILDKVAADEKTKAAKLLKEQKAVLKQQKLDFEKEVKETVDRLLDEIPQKIIEAIKRKKNKVIIGLVYKQCSQVWDSLNDTIYNELVKHLPSEDYTYRQVDGIESRTSYHGYGDGEYSSQDYTVNVPSIQIIWE